MIEELRKQVAELEQKGAMRTKHETVTLENLRKKIAAVQTAKEQGK